MGHLCRSTDFPEPLLGRYPLMRDGRVVNAERLTKCRVLTTLHDTTGDQKLAILRSAELRLNDTKMDPP